MVGSSSSATRLSARIYSASGSPKSLGWQLTVGTVLWQDPETHRCCDVRGRVERPRPTRRNCAPRNWWIGLRLSWPVFGSLPPTLSITLTCVPRFPSWTNTANLQVRCYFLGHTWNRIDSDTDSPYGSELFSHRGIASVCSPGGTNSRAEGDVVMCAEKEPLTGKHDDASSGHAPEVWNRIQSLRMKKGGQEFGPVIVSRARL